MDPVRDAEDSSDESEDDAMETEETVEENDDRPNVYLPGQPLKEGEELVCDRSAYVMLHQAQTGAPCLSFDVISDDLGDDRKEFPLTAYVVAGTQAARSHVNNIILLKLSNLRKTAEKEDDECDDDDDVENSDEEDDEAAQPKMSSLKIKHVGCVNRIRAYRHDRTRLAATWSETGRVSIWNLDSSFELLENEVELARCNKDNSGPKVTPLYVFSGHSQEGYAVDWSKPSPGVLATGDCQKHIHIWRPAPGGTWNVDQRPLIGHSSSVEDLQWSPNEANVLASCSVDKSIRIWDVRSSPDKACMLVAENAHQSDINVINWNKNEPFIVSGGDDGFLHVWDLRYFQSKTPVATFKHHTEPVTTVEWHPKESTVFASGGSDNQIALWDLSVEKDTEVDEDQDQIIKDIPPQLLFIHQGQTDIKEVHWHPQIPGVIISTAHSGFNIFKTISV